MDDEYISKNDFIKEARKRYCENCEKRKGMKSGKMQFLYEIGEAPCRACYVDDMIDEVENFPAADVVPVKIVQLEG